MLTMLLMFYCNSATLTLLEANSVLKIIQPTVSRNHGHWHFPYHCSDGRGLSSSFFLDKRNWEQSQNSMQPWPDGMCQYLFSRSVWCWLLPTRALLHSRLDSLNLKWSYVHVNWCYSYIAAELQWIPEPVKFSIAVCEDTMCDGNEFYLSMYLCDLCLAFSICSVHMALEQTKSASLEL